MLKLQYQSSFDRPKRASAGRLILGVLFGTMCPVVCATALVSAGFGILVVRRAGGHPMVLIIPALSTCFCIFAVWLLAGHTYRLLTNRVERPVVFTLCYRLVMTQAVREAWSRGATVLEPVHLLIGILACAPNTAVRALEKAKVSIDGMRERLDEMEPVQPAAPDEVVPAVGIGPEARRIIELAMELASGGEVVGVGTEHLLIALALGAREVVDAALGGTELCARDVERAVEELMRNTPEEAMVEVREMEPDEKAERADSAG